MIEWIRVALMLAGSSLIVAACLAVISMPAAAALFGAVGLLSVAGAAWLRWGMRLIDGSWVPAAVVERIKTVLVRVVTGSLIVSAALGVAAVSLEGVFEGELTGRMLATSLLLAIASGAGAAFVAAFARDRFRLGALAGTVATAVFFLTTVGTVWDISPDSEWLWVSPVWMIVAAYGCLLSLARLRGAWKLAFVAAVCCAVVLGAWVSLGVLDYDAFEDDGLFRFGMGAAIVGACATALVPIGAWLAGGPARPHRVCPFSSIVMRCPRCSFSGSWPIGISRCAGCGLGIESRILPDGGA